MDKIVVEKELYIYKEPFHETGTASLFQAHFHDCDNDDKNLKYVVKHYKYQGNGLEKELAVTHTIENHSVTSIVIPVLMNVGPDQSSVLLQMKRNGMFLDELNEWIQAKVRDNNLSTMECFQQLLITLQKVLESLQQLHTCMENNSGFLHLDLHPGNLFFENCRRKSSGKEILLAGSGTIKFIDFQTAVPCENGSAYLTDRGRMCSPGFSAPEIYDFASGRITAAADIYSVGAIFYYMLTGRIYDEGMLEDEDYLDDEYSMNVKSGLNDVCSPNNENRKKNINEASWCKKNILLRISSVLRKMTVQFLRSCLDENPDYRYQTAGNAILTLERILTCCQAIQNRDYCSYYEKAYEIGLPFREIENDTLQYDVHAFRDAAGRLRQMVLQPGCNFQKADYLLHGLNNLLSTAEPDQCTAKSTRECNYNDNNVNVNATSCGNDSRMNLYYAGIVINNKLGNADQTLDYYHKLAGVKNHLHVLELAEIYNHIANIYADRMDYQKAYEIARKNIKNLEILKSAYRTIAENEGNPSPEYTRLTDLGRAYSAAGTFLSMMGKDEALEYFLKGLDEFGDNKAERHITISHILHFAVDYEDGSGRGKKLYEQYIGEFFNEKDCSHKSNGQTEDRVCSRDEIGQVISARYRYAMLQIKSRNSNNPYPLWILMKGILKFYLDDISEELYAQIRRDAREYRYDDISMYPMNLIYRYAAQILYLKKGSEEEDSTGRILRHSMNCIWGHKINRDQNLDMIMIINYCTKGIYEDYFGNTEEQEEVYTQLLDHATASGWNLLAERLGKEKNLSQLLPFEYH